MSSPLDITELVNSLSPQQLDQLQNMLTSGQGWRVEDLTKIWLLRESVHAVAGSSGVDRVETKPALEGWHWVITAWSIEDVDNAATSARIGINSADYDIWLAEQVTLTANVLYHDTTVQVVTHNEQVVTRFVGATAGDDLVMNLHGFQIPPESPVSPGLLMALVFPQRTF